MKIVDLFLINAGEAKTDEDREHLSYVESSPAAKLLNLEKYYWLSPIVRYNITKTFEDDIHGSKMMTSDDRIHYLDLKSRYITDRLDEQHEFLQHIKGLDIYDYISKYRFALEFSKMNYIIPFYEHMSYGTGFEKTIAHVQNVKDEEEIKFKKVSKVSLILLLAAIISIIVLVVLEAPTTSIVVAGAATVVGVIQKIVVTCFHKKGFA